MGFGWLLGFFYAQILLKMPLEAVCPPLKLDLRKLLHGACLTSLELAKCTPPAVRDKTRLVLRECISQGSSALVFSSLTHPGGVSELPHGRARARSKAGSASAAAVSPSLLPQFHPPLCPYGFFQDP